MPRARWTTEQLTGKTKRKPRPVGQAAERFRTTKDHYDAWNAERVAEGREPLNGSPLQRAKCLQEKQQ